MFIHVNIIIQTHPDNAAMNIKKKKKKRTFNACCVPLF